MMLGINTMFIIIADQSFDLIQCINSVQGLQIDTCLAGEDLVVELLEALRGRRVDVFKL